MPPPPRTRRDTVEDTELTLGLDATASMDAAADPEERTVVEAGPPRAMVDPDVAHLAEDPDFAQRYVRKGTLGEGGMGIVSLHLDRQVGREVAVKQFHPDGAPPGERAVSRFLREARVQGQLEHPSVVPVYDLAIGPDGQPFFTMRRIRGLTLEAVIEQLAQAGAATPSFRERYSRRRLLSEFSRLCLAVSYAHEHGVVHRDLKPANVILGEFGEVYLLDWGLARLMSKEKGDRRLHGLEAQKQTMPGSVLGTPGYLSPEQARGDTETVDERADIYSLGAVLFEILTLEPLHDAPRAIERLDQTVRSTVERRRPSSRAPAAEIPPELDAVVLRATADSAGDRYATARQLHRAVELFLDGQRAADLRRATAVARLDRAVALVARLDAGEPITLEAQRAALRDLVVSRSLGEDGDDARRLHRRLTEHVPVGLAGRVAEAGREAARLRWLGGVGAAVYASMFLYLPFFAAAGVRAWLPLVFCYASILVAAGLGLLTARAPRPDWRVVLAAMVVSNLGLTWTAAFFGPLLLTPSLIAINTTPYGLYLGGRGRWISLAVGAVTAAIPMALAALGVISSGYAFEGDTMTIRSSALDLVPLPTYLLLAILGLGQVATAVLSVVRLRRDLDQAENAAYAQSVLLRGLFDDDERG